MASLMLLLPNARYSSLAQLIGLLPTEENSWSRNEIAETVGLVSQNQERENL